MIKEGDKVVCIKEHIHYRLDGNNITHKKGKAYKVYKYDSSDDTVYINAEEKYTEDVHGLWFNLNNNKAGDRNFIENYFITLAEWREKQINSILND